MLCTALTLRIVSFSALAVFSRNALYKSTFYLLTYLLTYSARRSYLPMLDPIQNHALRLCLGTFRKSATSLCVAANEPPLELRRTKLCLQYVLKLG